jgi:hypothetical protein
MTLFAEIADRLDRTEAVEGCSELAAVADRILGVAASAGYPPCRHTRDRLLSAGT